MQTYGDFRLEYKDSEGHALWLDSMPHFEVIHLEQETFQLKPGNMVTTSVF